MSIKALYKGLSINKNNLKNRNTITPRDDLKNRGYIVRSVSFCAASYEMPGI